MSEIEVKALNGLAERLAKLPKADRGISWELRNWQGHEQLTVYGQSANVCKWLLDNSEAILSALSTPPAAPGPQLGRGFEEGVRQSACLFVTDPSEPVDEMTALIREACRQKILSLLVSASPSPVDSRDGLEAARMAHRETLDLLHIRNEKLNAAEQRIERLVKALEPFAKLGDDGWGSACPSERVLAVWWADDDKDPHKTKRPHITQGDIRNARRALLTAKEQHPETKS